MPEGQTNAAENLKPVFHETMRLLTSLCHSPGHQSKPRFANGHKRKMLTSFNCGVLALSIPSRYPEDQFNWRTTSQYMNCSFKF